MKHKRSEILILLKNLSLIIFGTLVLAFGTAIFIIPMNLVTGGISSIAIILSVALPFLSIDLLVTVITWVLFLVGLIVLGKEFALKTLLSSIVYPPAVSLFLKLCDPDVLGGFFYLEGLPHGELALIVSATAGGAIVGAGCALTFLGGGSTGGVDILAFAVCKYFKKIKSSILIFIVDASTVIIGMFVLGDLVLTLLGVVSALIAAITIDKIFLGGSKAYVAQIITQNYAEMSDRIIKKLNRTSTLLDAVGAYSGEDKKMVVVSFTRAQYADLMSIVNSVDENAFLTVQKAHKVDGEGWTR